MNLDKIKHAYFIGIGGIGMSAIARYFLSRGIEVAGYDKTPTDLTIDLQQEGIAIEFNDEVEKIPSFVFEKAENTLLVYTPAIPADHKGLKHLANTGRALYKRSEVLGIISRDAFCIAVAGTHGKTTTSTLIAHLLQVANINFTAFLGGISSNYNSNYIHFEEGTDLYPNQRIVVLEADEFDRSFHQLNPDIAVITAIDPDHLDIYGTNEAFLEAFKIFASKIKENGTLIYSDQLKEKWPENIKTYSYGTKNPDSNFVGIFKGILDGFFLFDYVGIMRLENGLHHYDLYDAKCGLPGFHNIENATAALGVCMNLLDLDRKKIREGLQNFSGVKRRFEFIVRTQKYIVIDDYAHHPEELSAIITSVQALYLEKKITGIFQPHLFSRTKDFSDGFAHSLSGLHEVILMDIYPAREEPIEGITSHWLLEKIKCKNKTVLGETAILEKIKNEKPELLLILGAGDIDRLVPKIRSIYNGV